MEVFTEVIKTIVLGIIQGITEWLPISSTGHMILANEFLKLNVTDAFWDMFLVVIQFGSILAVLVLYFNKLNPFRSQRAKISRRTIKAQSFMKKARLISKVKQFLFGQRCLLR